MKKVKKKVDLQLDQHEMRRHDLMYGFDIEHILTLKSFQPITNLETLECFIEIEEPETIKEFLEQKGLKKKELVEWLNNNYK